MRVKTPHSVSATISYRGLLRVVSSADHAYTPPRSRRTASAPRTTSPCRYASSASLMSASASRSRNAERVSSTSTPPAVSIARSAGSAACRSLRIDATTASSAPGACSAVAREVARDSRECEHGTERLKQLPGGAGLHVRRGRCDSVAAGPPQDRAQHTEELGPLHVARHVAGSDAEQCTPCRLVDHVALFAADGERRYDAGVHPAGERVVNVALGVHAGARERRRRYLRGTGAEQDSHNLSADAHTQNRAQTES